MSDRWRVLYAVQSVSIDLAAAAGPAVLIRQNVEALRQAGHQATILHLSGRTVIASDGCETRAVDLGISGTGPFKRIESSLRRIQTELRLPYFGIFESRRFFEAAKKTLPNYDLCHEYHTLFSLGATLACRQLDIPRVMTVDADLMLERSLIGQPLRGIQALAARWAVALSLRTSAKVICVSEAARRHYVDNWGIEANNIEVLPNCIDPTMFECMPGTATARAELGLPGHPVVMFVGGFQPWHGLDILVEAFAGVVRRFPDARLVLVGDGPAREEIETTVDRMQLRPSVLITGYVAHTMIPIWLAAADVVVAPYPPLPAELWFSPLKLYEYMAAGKAIVASRAGQIAEVIQDGHNGLLVTPGDSVQLAQATIDLLENPGKRQALGEYARQQAIKEHARAAYTRRLEKIYQAV